MGTEDIIYDVLCSILFADTSPLIWKIEDKERDKEC
jgi:hypothetical protein